MYVIEIIANAFDGATVCPAAAVLNQVGNNRFTLTAAGGGALSAVGHIPLHIFQSIAGMQAALVPSVTFIGPVAVTSLSVSTSYIGSSANRRASSIRSFNPQVATTPFVSNFPLYGKSHALTLFSNAGGEQRALIDLVPGTPAEVAQMFAIAEQFSPDGGLVLRTNATNFLPLTSASTPLAAAGALALDVMTVYTTAGGAFGVTVPGAASAGIGRFFGVKNVPSGSANALTITPASGQIENLAGTLGANASIASATASPIWQAADNGNWLIWNRS